MSFNYTFEEVDQIIVIRFSGKILDHSEAEPLLKKVDEYLEKGNNQFVVNLSGMDYMNSTGLGILITILTRSRNKYGELVVCEIPEKINKLLISSKLQKIFKITENQSLAIEKLNNK